MHAVAQVELHPDADQAAVVAAQVGEAEDEHRDHDEQREPGPQERVGLPDHVVDDPARDEGYGGLAEAAEHRGDERDQDVRAVQPDLRPEAPDPSRRLVRGLPEGLLAGGHVVAVPLDVERSLEVVRFLLLRP